jgi:hypothetical protein
MPPASSTVLPFSCIARQNAVDMEQRTTICVMDAF